MAAAELGNLDGNSSFSTNPDMGISLFPSKNARKPLLQPPNTALYRVTGKDTIEKIALQFDSTPTELMHNNRLCSRMIYPGQELFVPCGSCTTSAAAVGSPPAVAQSTPASSPKKGPKDSLSEEHLQNITAFSARKDDFSDQHIKISSRLITDGQGIVAGILLLTSSSLSFRPSYLDQLVLELGEERYTVVQPMAAVNKVMFYEDTAALMVDDAKHQILPIPVYSPGSKAVQADMSSGITSGQLEGEASIDSMAAVPIPLKEGSSLASDSGVTQDILHSSPWCPEVHMQSLPGLTCNKLPRPSSAFGPRETPETRVVDDGSAVLFMSVSIRPSFWNPKLGQYFGYEEKTNPKLWFAVPRQCIDYMYLFFQKHSPFLNISPEEEVQNVKLIGQSLEETSQHLSTPMEKGDYSMGVDGMPEDLPDLDTNLIDLPPLLEPSNVLDQNHLYALANFLPNVTISKSMSVVFSTSKHGFSLRTLYREAQSYEGPCLLAIQDGTGAVFGSLMTEPPRVSDHFYGSGECLLFSFISGGKSKVYTWTGDNEFFIKGNHDSLCIGGGEGFYALWLDEDLCHGRSHRCTTFHNDTLSSKEDFLCTCLELWGFV